MNNPHIIVDPSTRRCMCGMYDGTAVTCGELLIMADKSTTVKMALLAHTVDCSEPFHSAPSDTTCAKCGAALSVSVDRTGWVNVAPHKCSPTTTRGNQP